MVDIYLASFAPDPHKVIPSALVATLSHKTRSFAISQLLGLVAFWLFGRLIML